MAETVDTASGCGIVTQRLGHSDPEYLNKQK